MGDRFDDGLSPLDIFDAGESVADVVFLSVCLVVAFLWLGWLAWKNPGQ